MQEQKKGDWLYIESRSLGQKIAFDRNSGWIVCEDKTRYSPAEVSLITKCGELPASVHILKKVFGGEIIAADRQETEAEKRAEQ